MKTLVLALFAILIITQFYSCENGDKMSTSVTSNENKEEKSEETKNQKSNEDSKSAFLSTEKGNIVAENSLQSKKEKPQEGDKVLIDANLETNDKYCATYSWSYSGCNKVVRVDNFCSGTVYFNIRLDNGYCMDYYVNPGAWMTVPINWCGAVYFNWGSCR
jgi:hypothetical protein